MLNINIISGVAIGGVAIGVLAIMLGAFPYLKKKNVNVDNALNTADKALTAAEPIIGVAKEMFPNNPAVNLIDFIDKQALKAVKNAQQLKDSSQLSDSDRKQAAQNSVYVVLQEIGITPTDTQKKLIDDAIEAAVYDLPHTSVDIKQVQIQNTQLQVTNADLQNLATQLQQKIATIQATVTQ